MQVIKPNSYYDLSAGNLWFYDIYIDFDRLEWYSVAYMRGHDLPLAKKIVLAIEK